MRPTWLAEVVDRARGVVGERLAGRLLAVEQPQRCGVELTPRLVRGLDYYTRTVFEVIPPREGSQAAIGGGGRYDGLAEALGGPHVPGVGYGMGLERVLLAVNDEGLARPDGAGLDAFVVAVGGGRTSAEAVAGAIRAAGYTADRALEDRPLGAQMRMADRAGARVAVVIGDREAQAGTVTWRRMDDGSQAEGTVQDVIEWLTGAAR